jgi:hypothetical protein
VYVVSTFVSGLIVESLMVMVARSNLECYISRANRSALLKVIKSICDVVVELDADYKLDEDAVALGSILLNCTGRSFKGSLFKEFMYIISECGTVSVMLFTWSCFRRVLKGTTPAFVTWWGFESYGSVSRRWSTVDLPKRGHGAVRQPRRP